MVKTAKTQEFLTKMELVCDMVYSKEDITDMTAADLDLMRENVARCFEIIKKAAITKAVG